MGDMADLLYEQELTYELTHGEGSEFWFRPAPKACKWCGEDGLRWIKVEHGWRLHDEAGIIHTCKNDEWRSMDG